MKGIIARSLGLTIVLAAGALTLTAGDAAKPAKTGIPIVTDWSSRHVVFSHPRTPEQAARLQKDVRYQMQLHRHDARTVSSQVDQYIKTHSWQPRRIRNKRLHRDWSWSLGANASVGATNFPAKYGFLNNVATCVGSTNPDFVVFSTGLASSPSQASIMALTNLYSGCSGQVPGSYWAYDTGGQITTSPVISYDGTQIAFTQTSAGTDSLVLLKWASGGTVQAPVSLTPVAAASDYPGCAAPCMMELPLGTTDTSSSAYYDYGSDTAFVGDDLGNLHQFTPVFKGTTANPPAEVTTGSWPAAVSANPLTSAVHASSGTTYVGDSGGFLYSVDSTGATVTASGQLDFGIGLTEGPILDSVAGSVYAFSSADAGGTNAGVFQLSTAFIAGDTGAEVTVGAATTGTAPLYDGAFDHTYIYSVTTTGNLYVCGNPGGDPTLYQIPITSGAMGTPVAGPILSTTGGTPCSPLTDVYNSVQTGQGLPQEWVFASVQAAGTNAGCTGVSCIMNFKVTQWQPSFNYNRGQEILDSNLNIEVAETSGTGSISGTTPPVWGTHPYDPTVDNGVNWRNQGPVLSFPADPYWTANNPYSGGFEIVDKNNNIEIAQLPGGTSGATAPIWATGEGATTTDGTVTWYNLGSNPSAGLPAVGGTSGIIIDNTVNTPGGSQVYFSTLGGGCAPAGTGGCAVQASQTGLN
ncbi:MAG TPA: hypothetical protein VGS78_14250 [Candidatus Sulfotelmatobacter sp.]|nr:hypothetical protein [Candidatus Sulfotelmatobacter sp.]